MNAAARNRIARFTVTASVTVISAIVLLTPAASAKPIELCDMEMGPKGLQCVEETKLMEVCKLDKDLKCVQPPKKMELCKLDKDLKCVTEPPGLCELEMGPDGLQCVGDKVEEPKTPDEPQPPVDPEPEPEPEPKADPKPQAGTQTVAAESPVEAAPVVEPGEQNVEIAAGPEVKQPSTPSYALWIGSALAAFGLLLVAARRRTQDRQDAASELENM